MPIDRRQTILSVGSALLSLLAIGASTRLAIADEGAPLHVALELKSDLVAGDRTEVIATVRLRPRNDRPLLVTPQAEGTAIEVVRGRLLRSDADDPIAETLRFRIAIVAKEPGDSILRVRVLAYACELRCEAIRGEGVLPLRVVAERRSGWSSPP